MAPRYTAFSSPSQGFRTLFVYNTARIVFTYVCSFLRSRLLDFFFLHVRTPVRSPLAVGIP